MKIITFCYILALIFITYIDCIMKKVILALVASAFVSFAYAQDVNFDSFKRIESDKVLNLSADQIAKIKKLNKEVGPKFRAIGRSNLPGYEKGQKKRALALEHKAAIRAILSENQIKAWETHYGSMNNGEGLRGIMKDDYDNRLDQLEAKFEKDKEAIENSSLSKDVKKDKVRSLKNQYKQEKERLENERDAAIRSGVLEK